MTNIEIRRKILEMVYERFREHPYHRVTPKEFRETLNINLRELHYNIIYLEEKGYLELQKPLEGNIFVGARITPKGIDLVEDEYQLNIMFPHTKTEKAVASNVLKEFTLLIGKLQSTKNLSTDLKELIIEEVKEISNELQKPAPSYSTVKHYLNKIKERDFETYKNVIEIIKTPAITKTLAESAKRELENI